MADVMLDLETMSSSNDAAIIAIGAVKFDPATKRIMDRFYSRVDLESSVDAGLSMSASTVLWWLQQSDAARGEFKGQMPTLASALQGFSAWIKRQILPNEKGTRVWGNGATFDNVVLTSSYNALKMERPWGYRDDRCYRTIKALYPQVPIPQVDGLIGHRADHDAERQAIHLMNIWPLLRQS